MKHEDRETAAYENREERNMTKESPGFKTPMNKKPTMESGSGFKTPQNKRQMTRERGGLRTPMARGIGRP